jgi:outer membrane protein OmpA-like peptidoglycan-associated protein
MSMQNVFTARNEGEDEQWISISDLMAGLMIIFLFIAITYIRPVQDERDTIRDIAVTFQEAEEDLYEALRREFKDDLPKWGAELDRETLSVRFKAPEVLFDAAKTTLKERFKYILGNFFPRYIAVLSKFREHIAEVRIEGHTSSEWSEMSTTDEAYFKNMRLSQGRTREVLAYSLLLPNITPFKSWLIQKLTANGLSSSQTIIEGGVEEKNLSRRVEFRVRTNAKQQMVKILETAR